MVDEVRRAQRAAISQAEIRRQCTLYGDLMLGYRAFQTGCVRNAGSLQGKRRAAWFQGWDMAREKRLEENG